MTTALAKTGDLDAVEQALVGGNIGLLTQSQRLDYYHRLCTSLGLNPLTQPFEYLTLNGKVRLYAKKDATDQLRSIKGVSVERLEKERIEDVYAVTAHVKNADGRTDSAIGAVPIANLKGEALANALMKAETKAKRRATLSICGLGFLDETELDTLPKQAPKLANGEDTFPCERCEKGIEPQEIDGKQYTVGQIIAISRHRHEKDYCVPCLQELKDAPAETPEAPTENQDAEPIEDPALAEFDGVKVASGTVTAIYHADKKNKKPLQIKMHDMQFSTFSESLGKHLMDCAGERAIIAYEDTVKGDKTYHTIIGIRNVGGLQFENNEPVKHGEVLKF